MTSDVWGHTKVDFERGKREGKMQPPHIFREGRRLCTGKNHSHGWLFLPRPGFNPEKQQGCPDCLQIIEIEKIDEAAQEKEKAEV